MGEGQAGVPKPIDPLESFRKMRDAYLDAMAKAMVEAVNTESYAQATGAMLETSLAMSAPLREMLEKTMVQVLQQLSVPSRQDVVSLAERFTNFEMRLDDIDAKLDQIAKQRNAIQSVAKSEPAKPEPVKASDSNLSEQPVKRETASAPAARKRGAAAKQAPRKKNARKGAR